MTIETAADLSSLFDTDDFAVAATIGEATVNGIFTDDSTDGSELTGPIFECASADVATVSQGDTITISATGYTVAGIRPDGTGVTVIILDP